MNNTKVEHNYNCIVKVMEEGCIIGYVASCEKPLGYSTFYDEIKKFEAFVFGDKKAALNEVMRIKTKHDDVVKDKKIEFFIGEIK